MNKPMSPSLGWRLRFAALLLIGGAVAAVIAGWLIVWSGIYDVSASIDHPPLVAWLLHRTMLHSVEHNAPPRTPPNLDDPLLILRGATHFASGCAPCHGAPGELASPIARHMTPVPPGLYSVNKDFTPSQLFWIVRNGIKMTAMPGWPASQREDEVWAMIAFLEHLPQLSTAAYGDLSGVSVSGIGSLLSGSMPGPAAPDQPSFDPADCGRCHGTDGRGRDHAFPQIAGLSAAYIEQALRDFRNGSRPSGFMQPVAAALSDAQIRQAATYYSSLPRQEGNATAADAAMLKVGQTLATAGSGASVPGCFSCHVRGLGTAAVPDLAGQPADYLADQLKLFRSGERGGTQPAAIMGKVAHGLSDQQITAVSAYLATLPSCMPNAPGATGCAAPPPN